MANIPLLAGSSGLYKAVFMNTATPPAPIPPPSQYAFTSSSPNLLLGTPTAFDTVPYTCTATLTPGVAITTVCSGINNGTDTQLFDIVSGTGAGVLTPGLPTAGGFAGTVS